MPRQPTVANVERLVPGVLERFKQIEERLRTEEKLMNDLQVATRKMTEYVCRMWTTRQRAGAFPRRVTSSGSFRHTCICVYTLCRLHVTRRCLSVDLHPILMSELPRVGM